MRILRFFCMTFSLGFMLCACSGTGRDTVAVNEQSKAVYNEIIKNELYQRRWNYDESENKFSSIMIDAQDTERYEKIADASSDCGYDISDYSGQTAVTAQTELRSFNGNEAGEACFYFINNKLVGEYYTKENEIYSLNDIDVFAQKGCFDATEDTDKTAKFEKKDVKFDFTDIVDNSDGKIAEIDSKYRLNIHTYNENGFKKIKVLDFTKGGFYPIDFAFTDFGGAVLLGKPQDTEQTQSVEYEDERTHSETYYRLKSWKLCLFDEKYNKIGEDMSLDLSTYNNIAYVDGNLILSRGRAIDIFGQEDNGEWKRIKQINADSEILSMCFADIDNDGVYEAVTDDGMDLYVYKFKNNKLKLLWNTNYSIESIQNKIYVADMNSDSVKEIYIEDKTGSTARYILAQNGFRINSADIDYGVKYIPADLNGDGKTDYFTIKQTEDYESENEDAEYEKALYIQKMQTDKKSVYGKGETRDEQSDYNH